MSMSGKRLMAAAVATSLNGINPLTMVHQPAQHRVVIGAGYEENLTQPTSTLAVSVTLTVTRTSASANNYISYATHARMGVVWSNST
jgi:hypothetical protein